MDNVIDFPGNKKTETVQDTVKQEVNPMAEALRELEQVNTQRKTSLEMLKNKVQSLLDNDKINAQNMAPATVGVLRDTVSATNLILSGLEAHDKLLDMAINDIVGTITSLSEMERHLFESSALVQGIFEALQQKGVLTREDVKTAWDSLVKSHATKPTQE